LRQRQQPHGGRGSERIDGQDVVAVYKTAKEAVDRARNGEGPTLIECKTYRYRGHCGVWGDPRDPQEVAQWKKRDPVTMFAEKLIAEKMSTEKQLLDIEQMLEKELDEAVEFAEKSPSPNPEEATTDVYAETSMMVDTTGQVKMENAPEKDLISKYWEGSNQ
jgi:pyruvate dehydrogenase E1 component alpha subunit